MFAQRIRYLACLPQRCPSWSSPWTHTHRCRITHTAGFGIVRLVFAQFHLYCKHSASSPRGSPHRPDRERPDGGHRTIARRARWGWRRIEMSAASGGIYVKFRIIPWRVLMLLAFSALLIGIPAAPRRLPRPRVPAGSGLVTCPRPPPRWTCTCFPPVIPPADRLPDLSLRNGVAYQFVDAGGYSVQTRSAGSSASSTPALSRQRHGAGRWCVHGGGPRGGGPREGSHGP